MNQNKPGTPQKSFRARMGELVVNSNRNVSDLAKELGVSVAMVEQWKKEFAIEVKSAGATPNPSGAVQPTKPTKISLTQTGRAFTFFTSSNGSLTGRRLAFRTLARQCYRL